ncbi:hypothetical protein K4A83_18060 [Spirulina subsalsa FACHB-351]|uniref:Uncharacterized protein n=1 Tax=Spirulina subsalsa FACHB-351 TaxID=234711 RepID=A0ABT3L9I8_9CYAN|nr:hypothetical protein [Spirulina subsalsa]MCW6038160.1 hypothetical protein [Spirulina subsalsa FACHB-351]
MEFPECTEENNDPIITIVDKKSKNKKSKVILNNPTRQLLKIIQIEDCVISKTIKGGRCDKLIVIPDGRLIFIELKGNDVAKAMTQLIDSINYIKQKCFSIRSREIFCIISCTRCPLSSTDVQKAKRQFKDNYRAKLIIYSGKMTYRV